MKFKISTYFIAFAILFYSCGNEVNTINPFQQSNSESEVSGKYHFLEDNGTKVYLPTNFERVSLTEYQRLLDSVVTKKEYKFETERLKALSDMDGSLYIYFDKTTGSTYTVNTVPHMKFSRDNASQLLGLIQSRNNKVAKNSDATFKKVTAKYGGNDKQQLFKAIYKVNRKKSKQDLFNASYIISSNDKTVFVQLSTRFETDFDSFIEKMLL